MFLIQFDKHFLHTATMFLEQHLLLRYSAITIVLRWTLKYLLLFEVWRQEDLKCLIQIGFAIFVGIHM